jgi:hypothetical protein
MPLAPECPQNSEKSMDFSELRRENKKEFCSVIKGKRNTHKTHI